MYLKCEICEEDNRQCSQLSVRTFVSDDNCQEDIFQGGPLSKKMYYKTYHDGYRWKGLDFYHNLLSNEFRPQISPFNAMAITPLGIYKSTLSYVCFIREHWPHQHEKSKRNPNYTYLYTPLLNCQRCAAMTPISLIKDFLKH